MDTPDAYLRRIQQVNPDIEYRDARVMDGQDFFVTTILLNGELIFDFPRSAAGIAGLKRAASALSILQGQLPLPVPNPQYAGLDPAQPRQAFIGYRRLPGVRLSDRLRQASIPANDFRRIVSQMANFMHALNEIPVDSLGIELPRKETREDVSQLLADIRNSLAPKMRPDAAEWVERLFEPFLSRAENFSYWPVVRHGRLTGENILVDPDSATVTGVLDFSALALGDPAMDVASLATISEAFFSELYQVDKEAIGPLMWRAQFYKSTFALREALAGAQLGNDEAYRQGMAAYLPQPAGQPVENPSPRTS